MPKALFNKGGGVMCNSAGDDVAIDSNSGDGGVAMGIDVRRKGGGGGSIVRGEGDRNSVGTGTSSARYKRLTCGSPSNDNGTVGRGSRNVGAAKNWVPNNNTRASDTRSTRGNGSPVICNENRKTPSNHSTIRESRLGVRGSNAVKSCAVDSEFRDGTVMSCQPEDSKIISGTKDSDNIRYNARDGGATCCGAKGIPGSDIRYGAIRGRGARGSRTRGNGRDTRCSAIKDRYGKGSGFGNANADATRDIAVIDNMAIGIEASTGATRGRAARGRGALSRGARDTGARRRMHIVASSIVGVDRAATDIAVRNNDDGAVGNGIESIVSRRDGPRQSDDGRGAKDNKGDNIASGSGEISVKTTADIGRSYRDGARRGRGVRGREACGIGTRHRGRHDKWANVTGFMAVDSDVAADGVNGGEDKYNGVIHGAPRGGRVCGTRYKNAIDRGDRDTVTGDSVTNHTGTSVKDTANLESVYRDRATRGRNTRGREAWGIRTRHRGKKGSGTNRNFTTDNLRGGMAMDSDGNGCQATHTSARYGAPRGRGTRDSGVHDTGEIDTSVKEIANADGIRDKDVGVKDSGSVDCLATGSETRDSSIKGTSTINHMSKNNATSGRRTRDSGRKGRGTGARKEREISGPGSNNAVMEKEAGCVNVDGGAALNSGNYDSSLTDGGVKQGANRVKGTKGGKAWGRGSVMY